MERGKPRTLPDADAVATIAPAKREPSDAAEDWAGVEVYTVGHSTRSLPDLIALLRQFGIAALADVRAFPRSRRNPQFNLEALTETLPAAGMAYAHLPRLGGRRRGRDDSPNDGWRNASFRAYADYMQTPDFAQGLRELRELGRAGPVALMCAEAVPWRCHRSLIADALTIRGVAVREIVGPTRAEVHRLTPFARVDGLRITYPADGAQAPEEPHADG